jgi:hypothetical protein
MAGLGGARRAAIEDTQMTTDTTIPATVTAPPKKAARAAPAATQAMRPAKAATAASKPARAADKPAEATKPLSKRAQAAADALAAAQAGKLPAEPNFAAPTHNSYRKKLSGLIEAAKANDLAFLMADTTEPKCGSRIPLCRYRDLAIIAVRTRLAKKAARAAAVGSMGARVKCAAGRHVASVSRRESWGECDSLKLLGNSSRHERDMPPRKGRCESP